MLPFGTFLALGLSRKGLIVGQPSLPSWRLPTKKARYSPRGGVEVLCFAMETGGRLHPGAEEELHRLADLARNWLIERGVRAGALLRRWRHKLSAALARAIATALLSAAVAATNTATGGV